MLKESWRAEDTGDWPGMTPKKIHENDIIGQRGINLIATVVGDIGFVWYPTGSVEAGTDGFIEIRDTATGVVLNSIILVQSKATTKPWQAETPEGFEYICEERDIEYWLHGNAPVILVVSRPDTGEAYWKPLKDYFKDPERRRTRKVRFDKREDRFDQSCKQALINLAVPRDAGLYLAAAPKLERLYSNLLHVDRLPTRLYVAESLYPDYRRLRDQLRRLGWRSGEWLLHNRLVFSVHDLAQHPWSQVTDRGTLEDFATAEWADSDDPDRGRQFVWLLNNCLREKVWPDLAYHKGRECYYFRATHDLAPRVLAYQSRVSQTTRTVFRGYPKKRDPSQMAYYRHSAFEGWFRRCGDDWYLEITPTYYFSIDGYRESRYAGEYIKPMKRRERNPAVLGQVVMWAEYLSRPADMFTPEYPYLGFGQLATFDVEVGIDDQLWLKTESPEEVEVAESNPPLFDLDAGP